MDLGIPFYQCEINETASICDISKLFPYIDSSWKPTSVNLKVFNEGITNKLIGCFLSPTEKEHDTHKERAAIVRIFGRCTEKFIERERELAIQVLLSKAGLAPPVFVRFANGVCYGFVNGQTVTATSVREAHISTLIAEKLAAYHTISLSEYIPGNPTTAKSLLGLSRSQPFLWKKIDLFLDIAENECAPTLAGNNRFSDTFGSIKYLRDEVAHLRAHIEKHSNSVNFQPAVGFCHNDLLLNNIIFDSEKDQVHFIDFEYADYNYVAFDIANHFVEYSGVSDVDYSRYPSKEYQMAWIRKYLAKRHAILKLDSVTEIEVKIWYVFVQKFALAAYLIWSFWGLVQNQFSTLDFDFLEFAVQRYKQYVKNKQDFFSLN